MLFLATDSQQLITFNLTKHVVSIFIVTLIIVILAIIINWTIKKADPLKKPKGLLLLVEIFVTMINDFTKDIMGDKGIKYAPYVGFLAVYLFISNILGLFTLTPPTSSLSVTLTLALITFFLIHVSGILKNGIKHFKSLFEPHPLMFPMNVIGELAVPVSLSFRLFGNILSGAVVMALIYYALVETISFATPFVILTPLLHAYFDLFSGLIQTFIFVLLTSIFISGAIVDEE